MLTSTGATFVHRVHIIPLIQHPQDQTWRS